eukprot:g3292.t1
MKKRPGMRTTTGVVVANVTVAVLAILLGRTEGVAYRPPSFDKKHGGHCGAVFYEGFAPELCLQSSVCDDSNTVYVCHTCEQSEKGQTARWSQEAINKKADQISKYDEMCAPFEALRKKHFSRNPGNGEYLALNMDSERGIARWVAHRVKGTLLQDPTSGVERGHFLNDPDLSEKIWLGDSAYGKQNSGAPSLGKAGTKESAYARGHIEFNSIFTYSDITNTASMFFSNIAPQLDVVNHPQWFNQAEKTLKDLILDNPTWEFYVVSGVVGGPSLGRDGSCMRSVPYPKAELEVVLKRGLPALFFKAYVAVDDAGYVVKEETGQGGWIANNNWRQSSSDNSFADQDHVKDFASVASLEEHLRSCCTGSGVSSCEVNLFPGIKGAKRRCAHLKRVKECGKVPKGEVCEGYCTTQGSVFHWGDHACQKKATDSCENGSKGGNHDEYKCDDTCASDTEKEDVRRSCALLHFVEHCKDLEEDEGLCTSACTDHGTFWGGRGAHRCQFVGGKCKNGAHPGLDGIRRNARKCEDGCEMPPSSHSTPTNIGGMNKNELLHALVERDLKGLKDAVNDDMENALRLFQGDAPRFGDVDCLHLGKMKRDEDLRPLCEKYELVLTPQPTKPNEKTPCQKLLKDPLLTIARRYFCQTRLTEDEIRTTIPASQLPALAKLRGLDVTSESEVVMRSDLLAYECYGLSSTAAEKGIKRWRIKNEGTTMSSGALRELEHLVAEASKYLKVSPEKRCTRVAMSSLPETQNEKDTFPEVARWTRFLSGVSRDLQDSFVESLEGLSTNIRHVASTVVSSEETKTVAEEGGGEIDSDDSTKNGPTCLSFPQCVEDVLGVLVRIVQLDANSKTDKDTTASPPRVGLGYDGRGTVRFVRVVEDSDAILRKLELTLHGIRSVVPVEALAALENLARLCVEVSREDRNVAIVDVEATTERWTRFEKLEGVLHDAIDRTTAKPSSALQGLRLALVRRVATSFACNRVDLATKADEVDASYVGANVDAARALVSGGMLSANVSNVIARAEKRKADLEDMHRDEILETLRHRRLRLRDAARRRRRDLILETQKDTDSTTAASRPPEPPA